MPALLTPFGKSACLTRRRSQVRTLLRPPGCFDFLPQAHSPYFPPEALNPQKSCQNGRVKRSFLKGLKGKNRLTPKVISLYKEAIQHFLLMARVDGRAHKTIELYHYVFDNFTRFLESETVPLSEIKVLTIRSFLAHLQDRGLKNTTIAIYLRVLKAFFNWLTREGLIATAKNPVWGIKSPRVPKRYPFVLTDAQVAALLKAPDRTTWTGFRNYTMLLTFLDVGLRLNELINLEISDLNLTQRSLKIHGKGAKDRVCFMGGRLGQL
ncbi:MAG: tyrosine-type recombinase/integrase [Candidatus Bipolaricaulia bacterium]